MAVIEIMTIKREAMQSQGRDAITQVWTRNLELAQLVGGKAAADIKPK
jgi:hypothetical protein